MAEITPDNLVPRLQTMALARGFPTGWSQAGTGFGEWQTRARIVAEKLVLPNPALREHPTGWREDEVEDRGSYDASRGAVLLQDKGQWPALFLRPKGAGPHPAVLLLHDHGSEFRIGKEKCVRPLGDRHAIATEWVGRFFDGVWIGDRLAAQGFAVLCVDALGWGARTCNGYESQQALACNLLQIGTSPAAVMAGEDVAAAAFLAGLPEVDPARVCAMGFSLGGFRAWQVAALSRHVAAAVAIGWMTSLPGLAVPGNNHLRGQSAFWMTHPGLHAEMDLPDLAGLAAPKPLYVEVAGEDRLFPAEAVEVAFSKLSAIWAAAGADDRLRLQRPSGDHSFGRSRQDMAFGWLRDVMGVTDGTSTGREIC